MEWFWIALLVFAVTIVLAISRRPKDPVLPTSLSFDTNSEIERLLAEGRKVRAIKVLRDATPGLSLEDAKARIDNWHAQQSTPSPASSLSGDASLPPAVFAEIDQLIDAGNQIHAIKVLREHTGWGLRESKEYIDRWGPGRG